VLQVVPGFSPVAAAVCQDAENVLRLGEGEVVVTSLGESKRLLGEGGCPFAVASAAGVKAPVSVHPCSLRFATGAAVLRLGGEEVAIGRIPFAEALMKAADLVLDRWQLLGRRERCRCLVLGQRGRVLAREHPQAGDRFVDAFRFVVAKGEGGLEAA
jgi:hypothetical protein